MSDPRIHLLFQWDEKYENYDNWIYFPNGKKVYLIDIEGVEELVRSLAKYDTYENDVYYCNLCYERITWYHQYNKKGSKMETIITSKCQCGEGKHIANLKDPLSYTKEEERIYDSKLKVTFGSGTWSNSCSKAFSEECNHQDCETCNRNGEIKDIIKPLHPLEAVCKELGVEVFFQ